MLKKTSPRQKAIKQELLHKLSIALNVGIDLPRAFALTLNSINFDNDPTQTPFVPAGSVDKAATIVADGGKPSDALEALDLFDDYEIAVLKAGFDSGDAEALDSLVEFYLI